MLKIVGDNGFEFFVDPNRITHFGIERGKDVLFIVADNKEWRVTQDVDKQYVMLQAEFTHKNGKVGMR